MGTMTSRIPKCQSEIAECNEKGDNNDCDNAYSTCMNSEVEPVTATGVNPYNLNIKCQVPGLCYDFSAETTWMKNYQQLITGPIQDNIRGVIYAGDLDFICNWLGNQAWSLALPWKGQSEFNTTQPVDWKVNGKAAGTIRQAKGVTNFTFVRMYDAGHMVPMDQPVAALQLVNQFITNTLMP